MNTKYTISQDLEDTINLIYKVSPTVTYQLRAMLAKGATELEVWKRIDNLKGSQLNWKIAAWNVAGLTAAAKLAEAKEAAK